MKRSERIEIIQSVAEHEEQQECQAMGKSQKQLEDELQRLEELTVYRQSYSTKYRSKSTLGSLQWQDYHRFLMRLDQAVAAQEQVVRDGKSRRALHQKAWMKKRQRLESLSRVVDRFRIAENDETQRQLDKLQDSQPIRAGNNYREQ